MVEIFSRRKKEGHSILTFKKQCAVSYYVFNGSFLFFSMHAKQMPELIPHAASVDLDGSIQDRRSKIDLFSLFTEKGCSRVADPWAPCP